MVITILYQPIVIYLKISIFDLKLFINKAEMACAQRLRRHLKTVFKYVIVCFLLVIFSKYSSEPESVEYQNMLESIKPNIKRKSKDLWNWKGKKFDRNAMIIFAIK